MKELIYLGIENIETNKWYTPEYIPELGDYSSIDVIVWTDCTDLNTEVRLGHWHCAEGAGWKVIDFDDEEVLFWMLPSYPEDLANE